MKMHGLTVKVLQGMAETARQWELDHRQRVCVRDKATGEICGAMTLLLESELF